MEINSTHGNMAFMLISRVIPFAGIFLSACTIIQATPGLPTLASVIPPTLQTTIVPTVQRELHTVAPQINTPEMVPDLLQCETSKQISLNNYNVTADMNYQARKLIVNQVIEFKNQSTSDLNEIVLNVKPNIIEGVFRITSLQIGENDQPPNYELILQLLTINLPTPLKMGCTISIRLSFQLNIPAIDTGGPNAYRGYLGYSDRQTNLGQWLPVVAVRSQDEWISHQEIPIGEQELLNPSNWDVKLKIANAPPNIAVAAPGELKSQSSNEWHFTLTAARDFSLSIGENYRVISKANNSGVMVEVYSFADSLLNTSNGAIDSAAFALDTASKSLDMFVDLYGGYSWERLVVVQGDFPDGMEFSGMVFVGGEYFRGFTGPDTYLMIITAHEIAHQWWYGRVGNDPALNPWLDEALATYSEYIFIEEYYPGLKNWWWNFRVNRLSPEGYVDSSVYDFTTRRSYINAVYLRGVLLLQELRDRLGTEQFFDWLRRYSEAGTNKIMTPDQFWSLLTPEQLMLTADIRQKYLREPQLNLSIPPT